MRIRAILAFTVALAGLTLAAPATSATAAPIAYPVTTCPTLSLSTTTPVVGESVVVTGSNFIPGATVRLELHTKVYVLGTVTVSSAGTFQTTVTMPAGVVGSHVIVAVGGAAPGLTCNGDPIQIINIRPGASSSSAATNGTNPTAFTGFDLFALIAAAIGLLGIGLLLNQGGRRRRRVSHAHHRA